MQTHVAELTEWDRAFGGHVVAIIGASGGIGRAVAGLFARAGALVIAGDRDVEGLARLESELTAEGKSCAAREVSVDSEESVDEFAGWLTRTHDRVDHLVNAAGVAVRGPSDLFPTAEWDRVIAINLTGTFLMCRALAPAMMGDGRESTIVNVASELALSAEPAKAAYIASKAGIVGLTRVLGLEWADRGIRVNAVAPGATRTPMIAHIEHDAPVRDAYLRRVPTGRFGEPSEIADGVAFLSSALSRHVVGQVLVIDGGYTVS
jgi:NAD(P)-dependent dehydrogenase (short-subunit alcohol dehydrogenase family)